MPALNTEKLKILLDEVAGYEMHVKKERDTIKLAPSEKGARPTVMDTATFVGRGWKYGTVEMRFGLQPKRRQFHIVQRFFEAKKVNLSHMCKERSVSIPIDKVTPKIICEWVVAVIL